MPECFKPSKDLYKLNGNAKANTQRKLVSSPLRISTNEIEINEEQLKQIGFKPSKDLYKLSVMGVVTSIRNMSFKPSKDLYKHSDTRVETQRKI